MSKIRKQIDALREWSTYNPGRGDSNAMKAAADTMEAMLEVVEAANVLCPSWSPLSIGYNGYNVYQSMSDTEGMSSLQLALTKLGEVDE